MTQNCVKSCLLSLCLVFGIAGCSGLNKKSEQDLQQEQALLQQEQQKQAAFKSALGLIESNKHDAAYDAFAQFIEQYPEYSSPWVNLAHIDMTRGDDDLAKKHLYRALEINPQNKQAFNILGVIARKAGQFEEAIGYYRKAIEIDPEYKEAILNEAMLLDLYLGRHEDALVQYELFQTISDEPDEQVSEWIYDLKSRLQ